MAVLPGNYQQYRQNKIVLEQVVEVQGRGYYLHQSRGHLILEDSCGQKQQVDLDRLGVLLLSSPHAVLSTPLLSILAQRCVPVILCGQDYLPAAVMLPLDGHTRMQQRVRAQIEMPQPRRKRLWQGIVQNKIRNQARLLEMAADLGWQGEGEECQGTSSQLRDMARRVQSGDGGSHESQAARLYWPQVFGPNFRRAGLVPPNSLLNYGYTVLLSCVVRAICCCGLLPAFGIAHRSSSNPFCLASDLMEPLRPFVDAFVLHLYYAWEMEELHSQSKRALAQLLRLEWSFAEEQSYLLRHVLRYTQNFTAVLEQKQGKLAPLELSQEVIDGVQELCALTLTK